MPATAPRAPTPTTAATKIATSSVGKATDRLMNPLTDLPMRPPTSAGTAPSGMPMSAPRPAGEEGERDRQARRDEDAVEDVAPERVRAERVRTARALRGRQDVDAGGVVRPEQRRDDREHDDRREADRRRDPDRRSERLTEAARRRLAHESRIVERGSITPSAMSTAKLASRTTVPNTTASACTVG